MRPYSCIILYQIYHLYKFNSLKNCKTGRTVESLGDSQNKSQNKTDMLKQDAVDTVKQI